MDLTKYKLIIFDVDGTLQDRDTEKLLPNVGEWFLEHADEHDIALASNQGGVGLRYWMETEGFGNPEPFPTIRDIRHKMNGLIRTLYPNGEAIQEDTDNAPIKVYVCFAYQSKKTGYWSPYPEHPSNIDEWMPTHRKPNPGMILQAIEDFDFVEKDSVLMVGDSEDDQEAAKKAGVVFMLADVFFGRPH